MSRRLAVLSLGIVVAAVLAAGPVRGQDAEYRQAAGNTEGISAGAEFVPGEVVVGFEDGSYGTRSVAGESLDEIEAEAAEIEAEPGVEVAGPNYVYELEQGAEEPSPLVGAEEPTADDGFGDISERPTLATNDPYYENGRQQNLTALKLPAAWNETRGAGVRVAVVDTGYYRTHPELADDVVAERDFVAGDAVAEGGAHHGTQVAGIAAGETNNGRGIAAAGWAATVLHAKACTSAGCPSEHTAAAVDWARRNGAMVINLSFGLRQEPPGDPVLGAAVQRALDANIVVLASAGTAENDVGYSNHYPAAYPGVLGVGSSVFGGAPEVSPWSNRGTQVDVVAPSEGPPYGGIVMPCNPNVAPRNLYCRQSGTSFSSAQVAGIAALVRAFNPDLTQAQVVERIQAQADDILPAGRDDAAGHGEADAKCSVRPDLIGCG